MANYRSRLWKYNQKPDIHQKYLKLSLKKMLYQTLLVDGSLARSTTSVNAREEHFVSRVGDLDKFLGLVNDPEKQK